MKKEPLQEQQRTASNSIFVQDDISITIRPASKFTRELILILIAALGFVGTWIATLSMFTPVYQHSLFFLVAGLAFLGYSILSLFPKPFRWLMPISMVGVAAFFFWKRAMLIAGFQFFYNHFYQNIYKTEVLYYRIDAAWDEGACTTLFFSCCAIFLACFICWFTIRHPFFPIGFLLTFFPIELGLYNGLEPSLLGMACVLVYWTALLAMQLTSLRYSQEQRDVGFFRKGNLFTAAYTIRTTMAERCGMIMAGLTALVFLISWAFFTFSGVTERSDFQEKREELKASMQAFDIENVQDSLLNIGAAMGLGSATRVQKLGRKNSIDIQNEQQLKLTLEELPDSAIYLKSFTGTTYDDNAWTALEESVWKEQEALSTLSETYHCYPQLYPYWFQNNTNAEATTNITISSLKWERRYYVPYATYSEKAGYQEDFGVTMESKRNYSFSIALNQNFTELLNDTTLQTIYLDKSIFNTDDAGTSKFLESLSLPEEEDSYSVTTYFNSTTSDGTSDQHAIQSMLTEQYLYRPFVYKQYTERTSTDAMQAVYDILPDSIKNAALDADLSTEALTQGEGESLSEQLSILEDIRSFLAEHASYSTTPGKTPSSRDFVNYFLLENQKGYCTHFATAGVLLARYAGIPARYCEGYVATPTDFEQAKQKSDGSYEVTLTDARAHAWCEFYVTGYGWIPFEFTPGYYGADADTSGTEEPETTTTSATAEPEVLTETVTTIQTTEQTITSQVTSDGDGAAATTTNTSLRDGTNGSSSNSDSNNGGSIGKTIAKILLCVLVLAAILSSPFWIRRYCLKQRQNQFQSTDRAKAVLAMYGYWEDLLAYIGISSGNQPLLTFSRQVAQQLQERNLPTKQTELFCLLISAVDLGKKIPTEEERTTAQNMVQELADAIYQGSTKLQKLYLKYIKHFI